MDYRRDNSSYLLGLVGGLAVGALAMYLLDPEQGRRRRALARDQIYSLMGQGRKSLEAAERDPGDRAQGWAAETGGAMSGMKDMLSETGEMRGTLH